MNLDILIHSAISNPFLATGLIGGVVTLGYVATQWWVVVARYRFEAKRNRLELDALSKKIEVLNLKAKAAPEVAWNGFRKFAVWKKVLESDDTYSFYLKPHDGKRISPFKPGQYLTFQFQLPGEKKPVTRCYSLSDGFIDGDHYRVTIKRALPDKGHKSYDPAKIGVVSSHFCDAIKESDIIDVKAPSGKFFLDVETERPVVLIGGGIGVTPMITMARVLTHLKDPREIYFFFGCRSGQDHMFQDEMVRLQQANPMLRLHVCYSRPDEKDEPGKAYNHESRVTVDLMKQILPSNNFEYYLCGPGPFMDSLVNGLYEWGVPKKDVYFEAFGPSTVKTGAKEAPKTPEEATSQLACEVSFAKSSKSGKWKPDLENIWNFAAENDVNLEGGCMAGNCGCCQTAIKSGEVEYPGGTPGYEVEAGCCLPCVACPKGNLVLDA